MELKIHEVEEQKIAEVISQEQVLASEQEALDLMAEAAYYQARALILQADHLNPRFYDLSTQLAGDILGKFSLYHMQVAIIGDFEGYGSQSLQAFIAESNRGRQVFFVPDLQTALDRISGQG